MQDQLFEAASGEFEQALALNPEDPRARLQFAVCLLSLASGCVGLGTLGLPWKADEAVPRGDVCQVVATWNSKVVTADDSWAKMWEKRSHERGEPLHIPGWKAGDFSSGATTFCRYASACASVPLCASWSTSGTMNAKLGSDLAAMSDASCVSGTMCRFW